MPLWQAAAREGLAGLGDAGIALGDTAIGWADAGGAPYASIDEMAPRKNGAAKSVNNRVIEKLRMPLG
jgi:hypothetical protein